MTRIVNLLQRWNRTPRTSFTGNEVYVSVCDTDPPIRGVLFHTQTLTSFLYRKARGVLSRTVRPLYSILYCFCASRTRHQHVSQYIAKEAS
jgi:hypothetical protein